ncbi:type II secretion system F family protein [Aliidiomarina indica]|uniref:type II secretion system F family protein n=1 Tax=Aliidiomarina indica TaxID=2749147 RepID=UPI00188F61FE|nr:type II secretion system F family protein [Aliidiomarina indica]
MMTLLLMTVFVGASCYCLILTTFMQHQRARVQQRQHIESVYFALPTGLDLVALQLAVGAGLVTALQRIGEFFPTQPLGQEFARICRQIRSGTSLEHALKQFRERIPGPQTALFVGVLLQAQQQGGAIVDLLTQQADSFRADIAENVERKAQELPVKLLMPLVALIFPATLIPVGAVLGAKLVWGL